LIGSLRRFCIWTENPRVDASILSLATIFNRVFLAFSASLATETAAEPFHGTGRLELGSVRSLRPSQREFGRLAVSLPLSRPGYRYCRNARADSLRVKTIPRLAVP
jgi:hypothetical protein